MPRTVWLTSPSATYQVTISISPIHSHVGSFKDFERDAYNLALKKVKEFLTHKYSKNTVLKELDSIHPNLIYELPADSNKIVVVESVLESIINLKF